LRSIGTKDDVSGEFGLRDGSAGLLGTLIKTDDWQEDKALRLHLSCRICGRIAEPAESRDGVR